MPEGKKFDRCFLDAIKEIFGIEALDLKRINGAFYKQYSALVKHACSRCNKFAKNQEDLEAKLWVDFMGSSTDVSLVEKFFEQASDAVPETLTAVESADFLGVRFDVFVTGVVQYRTGQNKHQWMPTPLTGEDRDPNAVYRTADIIELATDLDYVSKGTGIKYLTPPPPSKKHFINYLRRCINNRYANFCRTESRRHQERIWDTFSDQRSALEDPAPWEDRQETRCSQEEEAEVAILIQKLSQSPAGPHLRPILVAVYDQGYSIQEAIEKCEDMSEGEKRAAIKATKGYRGVVAA